ncbi:MAG: peptide chain release factor N(5)-glutamine methyltransferase [Nitrosomonadales bacterium]|nr:peptide chain release factor N(5)-glutamine methyltransferase [Nitrosomonadales bacterium]
MPYTLQSLLTHDKTALESALSLDSGAARIEVQMLLQQVLGVSRAHLLAHPEQVPDEAQVAAYRALLQRRLAGESLAYILGEREFFGLDFKVTPATLIPRPDTELLVDLALQRIPQPLMKQLAIRLGHQKTMAKSLVIPASPCQGGSEHAYRVLDLGTGSGAIALSIAHARPDIEVTAVDASPEALDVAQENVRRLNLGNARLLRSDWFSALAGERFDLIVSNPPYIAAADMHLAQGDLRFEPRAALASGADGLDDIRRIVVQAREHLNTGGWLLLEHGYDQAVRVRVLLQQAGFAEVFSARDLAGTERVSGGLA